MKSSREREKEESSTWQVSYNRMWTGLETHQHQYRWAKDPHDLEVHWHFAAKHHLDVSVKLFESINPVDSYQLTNTNNDQWESTHIVIHQIEHIESTLK